MRHLPHQPQSRTLGKFEGEDVVASIGRFGPYVRHAGKFVSIPKGLTAETISLEEAEQLIVDYRKNEEQRVIATFDEEPDMQVLNGRFGPYSAITEKTIHDFIKTLDVSDEVKAEMMAVTPHNYTGI